MKRSEMEKALEGLLISLDATIEPQPYSDKAKAILEFVERQGMLPPERYRDHDWNESGITYSQWVQLPSKVNEWEKDDD